jgi:hypothetical protein
MNGIGHAIDHCLKLRCHAVHVHRRPEHDAIGTEHLVYQFSEIVLLDALAFSVTN